MKIKQIGVCGTLESSDIFITITKNDGLGINIELESTVEKQFGQQIRKEIIDTLENLNITHANVKAIDKGALDCTVRARTYVAVCRACGIERAVSED